MNVELPGDIQLDAMQNETTVSSLQCVPLQSHFVKNHSKIINNLCWIRYCLYANMAGVSIDDNFSYQMPKIALTHDRNWSHVVMMVMVCLCLSVRSFKSIAVGFTPTRTDKRNRLHE